MPKHACIDPKHHVHDSESFVSAVEVACQQRGLRLTPIRARVLGLIADGGKPLKAYDLLDKITEANRSDGEGAGAAAPPTFTLFATRTLPATYLRYIERMIREHFDLGPTPIKIRVRRRGE